MPLDPTFADIIVRLALTLLAGALIGFNRETHGHTAGLRTTMLVGLAAAVTMTFADILVTTTGKTPTSFVLFDPMRLPLGILTGVGFIGGGTILKQGASITGITTAATLWIMTAIGLCFGGGQLRLGGLATGLCLFILWVMKWFERNLSRKHMALLVIVSPVDVPEEDLNRLIGTMGYQARFQRSRLHPNEKQREIWFKIEWWQPLSMEPSRDFLKAIEKIYRIDRFEMLRSEG
ncbi:MgtC/SapB family protein [Beijerinckia indica]|nr:MgtC/SapB family protein [Beijerinckia indica]